MSTIIQNLAILRNMLAAQDASGVSGASFEVDVSFMSSDSISSEEFSELEKIIRSDDLARFSVPESFLNLISHNLDRFSVDQKIRLARVLDETYGHFSGEAACMLVVEMLVVLLEEEAFLEFARGAMKLGAMQRGILAYGIGQFIKKANPSTSAMKTVVSMLQNLAADQDIDVRNEAKGALERYGRVK